MPTAKMRDQAKRRQVNAYFASLEPKPVMRGVPEEPIGTIKMRGSGVEWNVRTLQRMQVVLAQHPKAVPVGEWVDQGGVSTYRSISPQKRTAVLHKWGLPKSSDSSSDDDNA